MPNLIVQADETGTKKFFRIEVREGEFEGKQLGAKLSICAHPTCECTDVDLTLMDNLEHVVASFSVDVGAKTRSKSIKSSNERNNDLAGQIIRSLDDEDWKTLWRWFFTAKNHYTENLDLETLAVDFPMAGDIEEHGELVPFRDIFPHGESHYIEFPDESILLDEQYCLVSGCDCDRIAITFLAIQNGAQRTGEQHLVWVNYRTGKVAEIERGDSTTRKPEELFTAFMQKYSGLMGTYAKRHQQLTTLYKAYRYRCTKVERNEPCPCRSGKKYKRCCG